MREKTRPAKAMSFFELIRWGSQVATGPRLTTVSVPSWPSTEDRASPEQVRIRKVVLDANARAKTASRARKANK